MTKLRFRSITSKWGRKFRVWIWHSKHYWKSEHWPFLSFYHSTSSTSRWEGGGGGRWGSKVGQSQWYLDWSSNDDCSCQRSSWFDGDLCWDGEFGGRRCWVWWVDEGPWLWVGTLVPPINHQYSHLSVTSGGGGAGRTRTRYHTILYN